MKTVNQVNLLGNVCGEPEVNVLQNGTKVASFSVATSVGGYTKADGTNVPEKTQFHRVVAWRNMADVCEKLLHKGDTVFVQGTIEYSEDEKNGVKVRYTDIVASDISLCHSRSGSQQSVQQPMTQAPQPFVGAQPQQAPQPMAAPIVQPQAVPSQLPMVQKVWDGTQYVDAYQDPATGQWIRC